MGIDQSLKKVLRVALVGETNSGKTSLANLLLQMNLLPVDVLPNTNSPTLLRFGESIRVVVESLDGLTQTCAISDVRQATQEKKGFVDITLPSVVLREIEILDLPGLDSPNTDPDVTYSFVSSADIILWCSVGTQAWKASEHAAWLKIKRGHDCESLFVLTHRDRLSDSTLRDVTDRLDREIDSLFSHWTVMAVPQAVRARDLRGHITDNQLWISSGGEDFMKKFLMLIRNARASRVSPRPLDTHSTHLTEEIIAKSHANPSPPAQLGHLASLIAPLKLKIVSNTNRNTPHIVSASIATELNLFLNKFLGPSLFSNNIPEETAKQIIDLIPTSSEEILSLLSEAAPNEIVETVALIMDQLYQELLEATEDCARS